MEKLYKWPKFEMKLSHIGVAILCIVFPCIPASLLIMGIIVGVVMIFRKIWILSRNTQKQLEKMPLNWCLLLIFLIILGFFKCWIWFQINFLYR